MGKPKITEDVREAVDAVMGIIKHLVDHPDEVEVNMRPGAYRLGVELYTHSGDVGQVVGRNGHIGSSLRSILSAIAGKHKVKIDLDYITEEENSRSRREEDRYVS
jgi:hypothetical protein